MPTRPLTMRNLRRGGIGLDGSRGATATSPIISSGRVAGHDQFLASLSHALSSSESDTLVVAFRLRPRVVDVTKWAGVGWRPSNQPVEVDHDFAAVDHRIVFHYLPTGEIAGFLAGLPSRPEAERIMGRIVSSLFGHSDHRLPQLVLAPQLGAAVADPTNPDLERLLGAAASTLEQTTSTVPFLMFNPYVQKRTERERQTKADLARAVDRNEIDLAFQARAAATGNRLLGVEVSARWQPADRRNIPPLEFLRIAEEMGILPQLGQRLRERAAETASSWAGKGWMRTARLCLNIAPLELFQPDFLPSLASLRERFPDITLALEIQDNPILDEPVVNARLEPVRKLGIGLVLDNVSMSSMSVSRLQRIPLDGVNLAGSVIHRLVSDAITQRFATTVIEIAHSRGLPVTACQAETREQLVVAQSIGVDQVQGEVLTAPLSAEQMSDLLAIGDMGVERRRHGERRRR